jgi:hypothetical protein
VQDYYGTKKASLRKDGCFKNQDQDFDQVFSLNQEDQQFRRTHTLTEQWLAVFFLHHKRGESEVLTISLTSRRVLASLFPPIISRFTQGRWMMYIWLAKSAGAVNE